MDSFLKDILPHKSSVVDVTLIKIIFNQFLNNNICSKYLRLKSKVGSIILYKIIENTLGAIFEVFAIYENSKSIPSYAEFSIIRLNLISVLVNIKVLLNIYMHGLKNIKRCIYYYRVHFSLYIYYTLQPLNI
jgi:hypothetical protein